MSPAIRAFVGVIGLSLALAAAAWAGGTAKPEVKSAGVGSVGSSTAVLTGSIKPRGLETTYVVEYGPTQAYGSQTAPASAGSGDQEVPVSAQVTGLQPETTYHFRLVATNGEGTDRSGDKKFTTTAAPPGDPGPGPGPGTDPGTDPSTGPGTDAPGTSGSGVAEPALGKSVLIAPASGELRVRRPGSDSFVELALGAKLPVGSEVDARHGSLALTAALPSGATQTGHFGGGRFKLGQDRRGYVNLYLRGRYCTRASGSAVARAAANKPSGRRLWGRDRGGRFRTHGRNSHATVRGTRWVVVDTCKGTLTRVTRGSVVVRDSVRHKRIVLRAGERYLARPR